MADMHCEDKDFFVLHIWNYYVFILLVVHCSSAIILVITKFQHNNDLRDALSNTKSDININRLTFNTRIKTFR
jgi:hypothetical protein